MKKPTSSKGSTTSRERQPKRGQVVSLSPKDAVERDWIDELSRFENNESRDHRYGAKLPCELHQQLEVVGILTDKSAQDVFAFCLRYGLKYLLRKLPTISTIRTCRQAVLVAGSADIGWFSWGFETAARGGRYRRSFRKIDPDDLALCADIAKALGVSVTTLATVAVMVVLLEIRAVPDAIKDDILDELSRFIRDLRYRAIQAERLRKRARRVPPPSLSYTLDDAIGPSR